MTKRLNFEKMEPFTYEVYNRKNQCFLGWIEKGKWNRWAWEQDTQIIMSRNCLREVVEFMETLGGKG